jgi:hypothetical protein
MSPIGSQLTIDSTHVGARRSRKGNSKTTLVDIGIIVEFLGYVPGHTFLATCQAFNSGAQLLTVIESGGVKEVSPLWSAVKRAAGDWFLTGARA